LKLEVFDKAGERVEKHSALVVAEDEMSVAAVPEGGVLVPSSRTGCWCWSRGRTASR